MTKLDANLRPSQYGPRQGGPRSGRSAKGGPLAKAAPAYAALAVVAVALCVWRGQSAITTEAWLPLPSWLDALLSVAAGTAVAIATLRLTRKKKGGDAFMVIELDESPGELVRDHLRALPWVRWAFRLDKVSA